MTTITKIRLTTASDCVLSKILSSLKIITRLENSGRVTKIKEMMD